MFGIYDGLDTTSIRHLLRGHVSTSGQLRPWIPKPSWKRVRYADRTTDPIGSFSLESRETQAGVDAPLRTRSKDLKSLPTMGHIPFCSGFFPFLSTWCWDVELVGGLRSCCYRKLQSEVV